MWSGGGAAEHRLTFAAVKVNIGRKMMASLASGILVQTVAKMVMMAPDCTQKHTHIKISHI